MALKINKEKMKHREKCQGCGSEYVDDLGHTDLPIAYNVYAGKKLLWTYCSERCLKKHFYPKKRIIKKKFWFIPYISEKIIWINKKRPKFRYKVIGYKS